MIVLQGYGVTIDLHGETFISKGRDHQQHVQDQVPDQPVTSFELALPRGPVFRRSAANGNLCTTKLKMPTASPPKTEPTLKQTTQNPRHRLRQGGKHKKTKESKHSHAKKK